jgi:peptidoglycan hydrolase CwlO-like protein
MKKKGLIKKLAVLLISFSTILTPLYAAAAPTTTTTSNSSISTLEKEKQETQNQVSEIDAQLVELMAEVSTLQDQIDENQQEIDAAVQDIADAEASEQHQYEMMKKRMRYIYENDDKNIITLFCESGNFSDFLDRVQYTNSIYDSDKQMLDSYEATKIEIQEMKKGLEVEQLDLESQKKELSSKQTSLNAMLAQKKQELADYDTKIAAAKEAARKRAAELARQAAAKKAAENARKVSAAAKAKAAKKAAASGAATTTTTNTADNATTTTTTTSTTTTTTTETADSTPVVTESLNPAPRTSISGSSVVAYASQFIGNPYVWGGNSLTEGIDCSGFVVEVYKNFGINLSGYRNSASLRLVGQEVSYENIQAGDIICYQGHVGIATGAGTIVEAQSRSQGITNYRPYTCHPIVAIRRVI